MSTIAQRVGGSKATLYNYFSSKEELFAAVLANKCAQLKILYNAQFEGGDLRAALQNFGEHFLQLLLQDQSVAAYRLVIAECGRLPELGRTFYEIGVTQGLEQLAAHFERAIAAAQLKRCDASLMARYFFDLCMTGVPTLAAAVECRAVSVTGRNPQQCGTRRRDLPHRFRRREDADSRPREVFVRRPDNGVQSACHRRAEDGFQARQMHAVLEILVRREIERLDQGPLDMRTGFAVLLRHHVEIDDIDAPRILFERVRGQQAGARDPAEQQPVDAFMGDDEDCFQSGSRRSCSMAAMARACANVKASPPSSMVAPSSAAREK